MYICRYYWNYLTLLSSDKDESIEQSISGYLLKATQAMKGAYEEVDYVYSTMIVEFVGRYGFPVAKVYVDCPRETAIRPSDN